MIADAEKIIIDYLVSGYDPAVVAHLLPSDFNNDTLRQAFLASQVLIKEKKPVDLVTVYEKTQGLDTSFIGTSYYDGMDVDFYAETLHQNGEKKRLQTALIDINKQLSQEDSSVDDCREKLLGAVQSITPTKFTDNIKDAPQQIADYKERIKQIKENKVGTGIVNIDKLIRGVCGGEVLTVIARAGCYKTAFLQFILHHYAQNNPTHASVLFSIEMPTASLTERYMSMIRGMSGDMVELAWQDMEGEATKNAEARYLREMKNIYIVDARINLNDIRMYTKLIEQKYGKPVGVIGIDYLGLIDEEGRNEYEKISNIAKNVKHVARNINLPVIMLAQTNREAGDGSTEVYLHSGRGSGVIEEGADFILGNYQVEESYSKKLITKILKNRKGPMGDRFEIDIDRTTFKFSGESWKYEPEEKEKKHRGGYQ